MKAAHFKKIQFDNWELQDQFPISSHLKPSLYSTKIRKQLGTTSTGKLTKSVQVTAVECISAGVSNEKDSSPWKWSTSKNTPTQVSKCSKTKSQYSKRLSTLTYWNSKMFTSIPVTAISSPNIAQKEIFWSTSPRMGNFAKKKLWQSQQKSSKPSSTSYNRESSIET